jgi:hypothetical protein
MRSTATTPAAYIAELPPERRAVLRKLRATLRKQLPRGFKEMMDYGMLAYVVPKSRYAPGYHADPARPLPFINLASQKRHVALYHMGLYEGSLLAWFKDQWPKHSAAKLDLGKCCLRMTKLDHIPYELIGELASKMTPEQWIAAYEKATSREQR